MLGVIEAPLFVLGLVILILGRFKFPGRRAALRGKEARILGLTLMLPGLAPLAGVTLGVAGVQGVQVAWVLTALGIWETLVLVGAVAAAAWMTFAPPAHSMSPTLTLERAAGYLRVSTDDILALIQSGDLGARPSETSYLLDRQEVQNYVKVPHLAAGAVRRPAPMPRRAPFNQSQQKHEPSRYAELTKGLWERLGMEEASMGAKLATLFILLFVLQLVLTAIGLLLMLVL